MEKKRIVITGIGVVSPIGIGCQNFVNALREGKSGAALPLCIQIDQIDGEFLDFLPCLL